MLQVIAPHPHYNVCDAQMSSWGESSRPCNAHALILVGSARSLYCSYSCMLVIENWS